MCTIKCTPSASPTIASKTGKTTFVSGLISMSNNWRNPRDQKIPTAGPAAVMITGLWARKQTEIVVELD